MSELSGRFGLSDLLECAELVRSTHYRALAHPRRPTRPELWGAAREIFSRTPNGCGHRRSRYACAPSAARASRTRPRSR